MTNIDGGSANKSVLSHLLCFLIMKSIKKSRVCDSVVNLNYFFFLYRVVSCVYLQMFSGRFCLLVIFYSHSETPASLAVVPVLPVCVCACVVRILIIHFHLMTLSLPEDSYLGCCLCLLFSNESPVTLTLSPLLHVCMQIYICILIYMYILYMLHLCFYVRHKCILTL